MRVATAVRLALHQGVVEIKQTVRSKHAFVFILLFPVLMLALFGAIFKYEIAPDVPFTRYFAAGMLAAGLLGVCFQNLAIQIPIERDEGVLKRYRGTPMPAWVYFAGKVIMVLALSVLITALLLAVGAVFFKVPLPSTGGRWLTLAWVTALGITACTLLGIAFSSLARSGRSAPAVVTPVALVLQFISGVFILFTQLPTWMQNVAAVFPLKWMTQGMRSVFLPDSYAANEPAGSWELDRVALMLVVWCVVGLVLCLTTFRWTTSRDG